MKGSGTEQTVKMKCSAVHSFTDASSHVQGFTQVLKCNSIWFTHDSKVADRDVAVSYSYSDQESASFTFITKIDRRQITKMIDR
jgi:hypothetical protein